MKGYLFLIMMVLFACNNPKQTDFKPDFIQQDSYGWSLPVSSNNDNQIDENKGMNVPDDMRHLFYGLTDSIKQVRLLRLPDTKGYKVIVLNYAKPEGYEVTELYTFDADWKMYDRLQIESVEVLQPYSLSIIQEYTIDTTYRIRESKFLNELLIEQLTYEITPKGEFAEVRDGSTRTVAYEMFDSTDAFVVESFIWDYTPEGGLVKKDLQQQTYDLKTFQTGS